MGRDVAIDYLRSLVTVSVVAHHSALAYTTFSSFDMAHFRESPMPVVDAARFVPLDILVSWNDLFFMSLMFFISGLFVAPSIVRKGEGRFIADRAKRLGVPFILFSVVLSPIAFYPSWLLGSSGGRGDYLASFFAGGTWNTGPLWFLWLLLAFCVITAALFRLLPGAMKGFAWTAGSTGALLGVFLLVTLATTVPLSFFALPDSLMLAGPFGLPHAPRVFLYFAWFLMGLMLGAGDMERSLSRGNLGLWPLWLAVGGLSYFSNALSPVLLPGLTPSTAKVVLNVTLSFCCTFTILGSLGIARRFFTTSLPAADSLSDNAYGIYIFHYMFVLWTQFLLLTAPIPAGLKFLIVLAFALAASWTLTALARKTLLARVL